nr:MAG TPA: hypothetical protein [Bacteriophage sp.]
MKEIQCPFYISDAGRCIYCETLAPGISEVGQIFNGTEDKDRYLKKYCCGDHALCAQYICNDAIDKRRRENGEP